MKILMINDCLRPEYVGWCVSNLIDGIQQCCPDINVDATTSPDNIDGFDVVHFHISGISPVFNKLKEYTDRGYRFVVSLYDKSLTDDILNNHYNVCFNYGDREEFEGNGISVYRVIPHGINCSYKKEENYSNDVLVFSDSNNSVFEYVLKKLGWYGSKRRLLNGVLLYPVRTKGIRVYGLEHDISRNSLLKILSRIDVFLSLDKDNSPSDLKLLHALACGCSIVAFKNNVTESILGRNGIGYLAKKDSDIVKGIRSFIFSRERLRKDQQRSFVVVNNRYNVALMVRDYMEVYESVIN